MTDEEKLTTPNVIPLRGRKCPICKKPADATLKPFCSKRCADIDLGRWWGESYRIETNNIPDDDEEEYS